MVTTRKAQFLKPYSVMERSRQEGFKKPQPLSDLRLRRIKEMLLRNVRSIQNAELMALVDELLDRRSSELHKPEEKHDG